jgi:hypothetical protein
MLREGGEVASILCNFDEKKTNDTYMRPCGSMFVARIGFKIFGERLTLDNVIAEYKLTQAVKELNPVVLLMSPYHLIDNIDVDR